MLHRQRMIEQLSSEHQQLHNELEQSVRRYDAAKARVKVLETEQTRAKGQLKVLIQKADTDDSLIQALKDELATLREQFNAKSATTRRSSEVGFETKSGSVMMRLSKMCSSDEKCFKGTWLWYIKYI